MKVALFQMTINWEDKEKNYTRVEERIEKIKMEDIDLFLLPEMSFTGFSMNIRKTKESNEETIQVIRKIAQKYEIAIGFGWVKDCGSKAENHYTIVNYKGQIISDYIKIHPFSYSGENEKFRGGENISFFSLDDITFSNFICYDLRFPEIFQIASKRADIIIVSANWPAVRSEHWKCLLRARAIENQVYILAINCVGEISNTYYSGDSCVINPNGDILEILSNKEGIVLFEFKDRVSDYRKNFPVKKDRRENLYFKLWRDK